MTTLPTLLVVLLGLASPVVAVVAIVAAELRERNRQEHELKMQRGELEDRRLSRLREDRLRSYSTLARLSKVIEPTPAERSASDLAEVLADIELLTDDPRLLKTAGELVAATALTRMAAWRNNRNEATQEQVDSAMDTLKKCRVEFNRLAKEEVESAKEELEARLSEDG
jgi:hypothetical protein